MELMQGNSLFPPQMAVLHFLLHSRLSIIEAEMQSFNHPTELPVDFSLWVQISFFFVLWGYICMPNFVQI